MKTEERLAIVEVELRQLVDRQAIFDCIKRSSRGNDRFDVEMVASSYHEDSLHELGDSRVSGWVYAALANDAHAAICDANLHNITMQSCEIDGDVAHAESYVIGLFIDKGAETSRMIAGRYIDRLERRGGEWRIALRRGTLEVAMEGKAVLPGGGTPPGCGYLKGSRDRSDPSYERPLTTASGERW